jgi:hypothetical protein
VGLIRAAKSLVAAAIDVELTGLCGKEFPSQQDMLRRLMDVHDENPFLPQPAAEAYSDA